MNLQDLKNKEPEELLKQADELEIENPSSLRKQDLMFAILKKIATDGEIITGLGVIEIMQDGFGFLRSAESNYLPGPDDIYVSPTQIKKFSLRTGDSVEGEIRAPKQGERYFAITKINTINGKKTLKRVRGNDLYSGENVSGYEMHIGVTKGPALNRPWLSLEEGRKEGVMSEDGLVMGTYIHGLFESDGFRRAFLRRFRDGKVQLNSYENLLENTLDMLAERLEDHIEMDKLMSLLWR